MLWTASNLRGIVSRQAAAKLGASRSLDFGFLAEALLFYQNVHLIVDQGMLEQLVRECGPQTLIELMEEEFLKVSYTKKTASIENIAGLGLLRPNTFWVNDGSWELDRKAPEIFSKVAGVDYGPNVILTWRADMRDGDFVYQSVIEVLKVIAPSYRLPKDFRFDVIPDDQRRVRDCAACPTSEPARGA